MQTTKRKSAGKCIELRFYIRGDFEAQLDKTKEVIESSRRLYQQHRRRKLRNRNGVLVEAPITVEDFERGVIKQ